MGRAVDFNHGFNHRSIKRAAHIRKYGQRTDIYRLSTSEGTTVVRSSIEGHIPAYGIFDGFSNAPDSHSDKVHGASVPGILLLYSKRVVYQVPRL